MKLYFNITLLTVGLLFGCKPNNQKKVEKALSEWIKLNADYPDSYISNSFSNFTEVDISMSSYNPQIYYRIIHSYNLKSKDNIEKVNKHFFVLNKDFKVALISNNITSMVKSVPPAIFEWAIMFGENFKKVDFGGLDTTYYFKKFGDYKNIGGNIWNDFDYLDDVCLQSFIKSLKNYHSNEIRIKRIIKAVPEFQTDFEKIGNGLNELGMDIYKGYGMNPQTNFAVIQSDNDKREIYSVMSFDETKNEIQLKGINENKFFSYSLDTTYMSSNCFNYSLKFRK